MSENNNQNNNEVEELDINHLMQIRRDKLKELQEEVDSFINLDVNHSVQYKTVMKKSKVM